MTRLPTISCLYVNHITSNASRWVVLKRRVGAVTSQRVLKVLFYVNILQCFFVVEHFTTNAVSVAIRDNGNRLIFEIWWVITGDLNIIQHESLRKVISDGPKFREPQHINWKHNFKIIMDAVEDYARGFLRYSSMLISCNASL
jgi:hypothetical protein